MLGRSMGVLYGAPLLIFAARGMIPTRMRPRMAILLGLGGSQGASVGVCGCTRPALAPRKTFLQILIIRTALERPL